MSVARHSHAMSSGTNDSFDASFSGGDDAGQLLGEKEQHFMQFHRNSEQQFMESEAEVMRLLNGVHLQKVLRDHASEKLGDHLKQVKTQGMEDIYASHVERHLVATRLEQDADKYAAEVRGTLAEDKELQEESKRYMRDVQAEICHLYTDSNQVTDFRIERSKKLAEGVASKLDEIRIAVTAERRIREESESTLLELFGQMGDRIATQLEANRRERIETADRLTSLVESATKLVINTRRAHGKGIALSSSGRNSQAREVPF